MIKNEIKSKSKFLSLILRHNPGKIGLELDANGWADIEELITLAKGKRTYLTMELIEEIVEQNDKKRFSLSEDGKRIRANQGHSVQVDVELKSVTPPEFLYHGTATRFLDSILESGLNSRNRLHVHLSKDLQTATKVGQRHGKVVILQVASGEMAVDGTEFYLSENGVWLCDQVDKKYLRLNKS